MAQTDVMTEKATALQTGRVQCVLNVPHAANVLVSGNFGMVTAQRAASCLLAPEAGDTVLVVLPATDGAVEHAYVLGILERSSARGQLVLPDETSVATRRLEFTTEALSITSRVLTQTVTSLRCLVGSILERAGKRMGLYGRRVENITDVCETKAGRIRTSARETLRVRARNADVRAEQSVVLDGENLKIG